MAAKPLQIRAQAIALLSRPGISHEAIAASLNCSVRTIRRISAELRPHLPAIDAKLAELQSQIGQRLTIPDRAAKYVKIVTETTNDQIALNALQRIDDLDGIVTEKERLRRQPIQSPAPGPMFVFPSGTHIDFGGVTIIKKDSDDSTE